MAEELTRYFKPCKCCRWVTVEWDKAAECWMVDIRFETAPPENEWVHMAFGNDEMKELVKKLKSAMRRGKR